MSTDEQLSSSYQVLTSLENAFYTNMTNHGQIQMTDRIMSIVNDRLDDAQHYKDQFKQNSMQPIIFDILREIKQKNGEIHRVVNKFSDLSISVQRNVIPSICLHHIFGVVIVIFYGKFHS